MINVQHYFNGLALRNLTQTNLYMPKVGNMFQHPYLGSQELALERLHP